MLKTVYRSSCRDKHNCQRRESNSLNGVAALLIYWPIYGLRLPSHQVRGEGFLVSGDAVLGPVPRRFPKRDGNPLHMPTLTIRPKSKVKLRSNDQGFRYNNVKTKPV